MQNLEHIFNQEIYIATIPEDRHSQESSIRDFIWPLPVWFSACVSYGPWLCPCTLYIFEPFFFFNRKTLATQYWSLNHPKGMTVSNSKAFFCISLPFLEPGVLIVVQTFICYACMHILVCVLIKSYNRNKAVFCLILLRGWFPHHHHLLELCSPDAAPLQFSTCPSALVLWLLFLIFEDLPQHESVWCF